MRNQCWTKSMYWNRGDIPRWNRKLVLKTCYKFVGYSMFFVDASSRNSAANEAICNLRPTLHDEFALSLTEIFIELHMWCYALYQMKQKSHVKRARNCCNGRIRPSSSNFVQVRPNSSNFVQIRPFSEQDWSMLRFAHTRQIDQLGLTLAGCKRTFEQPPRKRAL